MKYIITAIICSIILSISFVQIQVNKQNSIERQKQMQIDQDNKKLQFEIEKEQKANQEKANNKLLLTACLQDAEIIYWDYAELNGTKNADGTITAYNNVWTEAEKRKKNKTDICFKKYK